MKKECQIKAVLIDDEPSAIRVLSKLLDQSPQCVEVVGTANNLLDGIQEIRKHAPDLVFLDVQMPRQAGYEIVNYIDNIDFHIIFVTAFDQYAVRAFEVNAIDYLLKPVNRSRLYEAVQKVQSHLLLKATASEYVSMVQDIERKTINKIIIPQIGERKIISVAEIKAIEAEGAYTKIYMQSGLIITTSKNLKYFDSILEKHDSFFRCHRSWLVNLHFVTHFNKTESTITLEDGLLGKIARTQYEDFEAILRAHIP